MTATRAVEARGRRTSPSPSKAREDAISSASWERVQARARSQRARTSIIAASLARYRLGLFRPVVRAEARSDHGRAPARTPVDRLALTAPGLVRGEQPVRRGSRSRLVVVALEEPVQRHGGRVGARVAPLLEPRRAISGMLSRA